jgi:ParB family chromosome partitioning protein
MAKTPNRLGRGLNALITPRETQPRSSPHHVSTQPSAGQIQTLAINRIKPNPRQPRTTFDEQTLKELADSIRDRGMLQPIVVRGTEDGQFEIVAGERRWRAARSAGFESVPAIVREFTDAQAFETALVENLQREDLAPLERAAAYQHYLDTFGGTIEDLATRVSESRANISNYLRLLKLQPEVCYLIGSGELSMGHARAIAGIDNPKRQLAIAKMAARRNLSVRQVEELARAASEPPHIPPEPTPELDSQRRHLSAVADALSKSLGLRVRLFPGRKKNSGRVVINYGTLEEFDHLAEHLGGKVHLE